MSVTSIPDPTIRARRWDPTKPPPPVIATRISSAPGRRRLRGPVAAQYDWDRSQKDAQVEPERCLPDVGLIKAVHLEETEAAATAHLPEPGDPGPDLKT